MAKLGLVEEVAMSGQYGVLKEQDVLFRQAANLKASDLTSVYGAAIVGFEHARVTAIGLYHGLYRKYMHKSVDKYGNWDDTGHQDDSKLRNTFRKARMSGMSRKEITYSKISTGNLAISDIWVASCETLSSDR